MFIIVTFKTKPLKGSGRLLGVGLETVLGLTGYHCLGMSELFSDVGVAVSSCLRLQPHGLRCLHPQRGHRRVSVSLQQWDGVMQDSVDEQERSCALRVNNVPFVPNAMW